VLAVAAAVLACTKHWIDVPCCVPYADVAVLNCCLHCCHAAVVNVVLLLLVAWLRFSVSIHCERQKSSVVKDGMMERNKCVGCLYSDMHHSIPQSTKMNSRGLQLIILEH